MLIPTTPTSKDLGNGFILRSLADGQDVERLASFSGTIHGEGVAGMTRELILHHPHTRPEHWLYVEEQATGQIVSSLCLIPWKMRYEEVELTAGEMGIVATSETYRHRGLVRAQVARHAELLCEGDFDLSHIQGIPYFYRQFGYEYAMPLEGGWRVELHTIPGPREDATAYTFRNVTQDDLPVLLRLYDEAAADLAVHVRRDEAEWRYLLGPSLRTEMIADTWLVLDDRSTVAAYFRVPHHGFGEGLIVNEASRMGADLASAVLRHLKVLGEERAKPYIRLCLPGNAALVQTARYHGAHDMGHYAWQIKLVDVARLLTKIAPVLERRLAASPLAGLTRTICLSLYREGFELAFQGGRLVSVQATAYPDRADMRIPPLLLAPLLLGYRSREELADAHHDLSVHGEIQYLVDVLFPKMTSFLYTVY